MGRRAVAEIKGLYHSGRSLILEALLLICRLKWVILTCPASKMNYAVLRLCLAVLPAGELDLSSCPIGRVHGKRRLDVVEIKVHQLAEASESGFWVDMVRESEIATGRRRAACDVRRATCGVQVSMSVSDALDGSSSVQSSQYIMLRVRGRRPGLPSRSWTT